MNNITALIISAVVGLAAGYLLRCWMLARKTGEPLRAVMLGGGPKPTTPA